MAATVTPARNLYGEITDRFLSPAIWASFPWQERMRDPSTYLDHFDDFHNLPDLSADANGDLYATYIDTSNTISTLVSEKMNGVCRLSLDATDNDGPVLQMSGTGNCVMISDTAGDDLPLWFEARWRKSSVSDNAIACFIGLAEEALTADDGVLVDDTGVLTDKDHIGFNVAHDNGEELNFAYVKAGQTDNELMAALDSLVAATWVKTGFQYSPDFPTTQRIKIHLNNSEQSTYVTGALIAAAAFPDAEELTPTFAAKNGTGATSQLDIDWFRIAQKMRAS